MQDKGIVRWAMERHRGFSKARAGMVRHGKNIWGRVKKARQGKAGVGKEVRFKRRRQQKARPGKIAEEKSR